METTADAKEMLRKFFAEHAETELTKGDVEQWLKTLGAALKKKDVYSAAAQLSEYLVDVKGYGTGEDYQLAEQGDVEETRTNAKLTLSDVSVRTIVRYMTGAQTAQQQQQPQQEQEKQQGSPEQDSMATGSSRIKLTRLCVVHLLRRVRYLKPPACDSLCLLLLPIRCPLRSQ